MDFEEVMDLVARAFEVLGVAILVVGAIASIVRAVGRRATGREFYRSVRTDFGHTLLLGLEVLVAADIVKTVAVDSTLESVAILGILVLVRTLLSISLDAEIDGVWPWRRRRVELEESQALRR
jgi:uncharacterized membrane protein